MANSPRGFIPSKILQQAIEDTTVRNAALKVAKQSDYFQQLVSGVLPPPAVGNGAYQTDGTFTEYCVYDVGAYDVDPYGP